MTAALTKRRPGLRRRLDNMALRLQARVDAAWTDRVVPWAAAAVLFVVLLSVELANIRQLDGGSGLGGWLQAAWRFRNGEGTTSTLTATDLIRDQWSFIAYPVLWATRVVPARVVLAVVQAGALAVAVVPLWRIARETAALRIGTTAALLLAYAIAPIVQAANLTLFRPEVIAVPLLFWALLSARRERWRSYWLALAVVLLCRADLGLTVAAVGLLVLTEGRRRVGLATTIIGVGWAVMATIALEPELPEGPLTAAETFGALGSAPLAVLRTMFSDPTQFLDDLFSPAGTDVVLTVFGPLLFLPLVAPRYLSPGIPALVLGTAAVQALARASEPDVILFGGGSSQLVEAAPFVFLAAIVALSRIGRRNVERVLVDHRIVAALTVGAIVFFAGYAPSSPHRQPWQWGGRDQVDAERLAAVDAVDPDVPIAVTPQLTERVAERAWARELPFAPPSRAVVTTATRRARAVIVDTTGEDSNGLPLWGPGDRTRLQGRLAALEFEVVYSGQDIVAFARSG